MTDMISVVVPIFNEEQNIQILYDEVKDAFLKLKNPYEIILVDDGSVDKSASIIRDLAGKDVKVKAVIFKRNYGQTSAIAAGIDCASGEYVMTMDADLQNDPNDARQLIEKIGEGYDLVSGWRKDRKEPFFNRRLPSFIANRIISGLMGLRLHDYGCTLKLYKKDMLKNVNLYGEMHRFIPIYIYWMGGKVAEIPVNHRPRRWGKSKYSINRTIKVILDLITVKFLLGNYSTSPIYFFGGFGLFLMLAGAAGSIVTLIQKFVWGFWVHRNPLLLLSVFSFVLGAQVIFIGLLAELSVRIYYETTRKSIYTVEEKINC